MKNTLLILFILSQYFAFAQSDFQDKIWLEEVPNEKSWAVHKALACKRSSKLQAEEYYPGMVLERNYDVIQYDLTLNLVDLLANGSNTMTYGHFHGVNKITVNVVEDNSTTFTFDKDFMDIDSVKIDDVLVGKFEYDDKLDIFSSNNYSNSDEIRIDIYFTVIDFFDGNTSPGNVKGARYYDFSTDQESKRLLFTLSEPIAARTWMPCNDHPHDKAKSKMTIITPIGYSAVANGNPIWVDNQDGTVSHFYDFDFQITTYLMAFAATKFDIYNEGEAVLASGKKIPLSLYSYQELTQELIDLNMYEMQEMLLAYGAFFTEYPFDSYGYCHVPMGGAMEHTTMTFGGSISASAEWIKAHELAHHWLGDIITCKTWGDLWINEGGATWGEALWYEYANDLNFYMNVMRNKGATAKSYEISKTKPSYIVHRDELFKGQNFIVNYTKAAFNYHHLRMMLGDDVFFAALRNIINKNAYTSISTDDMTRAWEEEVPDAGFSFETYFDAWVYNAGYPEYVINFSSKIEETGLYTTTIEVEQAHSVNDVRPEYYPIPIRFDFSGDESGQDSISEIFINNARMQTFDISSEFEITSLDIDYGVALAEVKSIGSSNIAYEKESLVLYPVPSEGIVSMSQALKKASGDFHIFDISGNLLNTISPSQRLSNYIDMSELDGGVYFVVVRGGNHDGEMIPFIISK